MATPKPVVTIGDNNALPNPETENKVNSLPGKSKAFVAKHTLKTIDKTGAEKSQFTADKVKKDESKLASYKAGKDAQVYEEVELEEEELDKATRDKLSVNKIKRDAQLARNGIARRPGEGLAAYVTRVQKHKAKMQKEEVEELDEVSASDAANAGRPQLARAGNAKAHALAKASETAQEKSKVSLKKAPWEQKEEVDLGEDKMTKTDIKQRETFVKGMKKNAQSFKDKYGDRWKSVMYAVATKNAMKEATILPDNFSDNMTPTPNKRAYAVDKANSEKKPVTLKKAPWEQKEEVELDEVSDNLKARYSAKAKSSLKRASTYKAKAETDAAMADSLIGRGYDGDRSVNIDKQYNRIDKANAKVAKHDKTIAKRSAGLKRANEEVEQIDELSKDTLVSYALKAHNRGDMAARMSKRGDGKGYDKDMAHIANKRFNGVQSAIKKIAVKEDVELELLNKLYESLSESNQKIMAIMLEDGREADLLQFAAERFNDDV